MSTRRRDRVNEKEPARSDGERTGTDPEETNQPTPSGGSLHIGHDYIRRRPVVHIALVDDLLICVLIQIEDQWVSLLIAILSYELQCQIAGSTSNGTNLHKGLSAI
ncbi:hypothetical protein T11_13318 [Trichinella zimbabwensis]|uniref:Uncharacterized protein n=2 Tax=Trichinella zimbabwensis TaxID=268475 RepID=A0A0V1HS34_9BILA|nr:hypothetical protein T11_13318 [Trichinella zimbabwensis]